MLCTIDGQIDPTVNLIVVFPSVCNKMSDLATSSPHVGMMWNGAAKRYQASLCQIKALIWLGGSGNNLNFPQVISSFIHTSKCEVRWPMGETYPLGRLGDFSVLKSQILRHVLDDVQVAGFSSAANCNPMQPDLQREVKNCVETSP